MFNAYLILDKRSLTKKGHPIKIYISGKGQKTYIATRQYSDKKYWKNGKLLKGHPTYAYTQNRIRKMEIRTIERLSECDDMSFNEAIEYVKGSSQKNKETMLFEFWDVLVPEKKKMGRSTTPFEATRKQLENYMLEDDIAINDIDYEFLQGFIAHKKSENCNEGGVNYYLKTLRTVYLEAQRRSSLNIKSGNPFTGLIKTGQRKPPVTLNKNQFLGLMAFEPNKSTTKANKEKMTRKRDLFLFQIYIGGHDFIEVANLRWEDIREGRIKFYRYKNSSRNSIYVDNALLPKAKEIIKKYGTEDNERVFSFIPDPVNKNTYDHYRSNTNGALKVVADSIGVPRLSTKSPRYIFRSWAGEAEADILATMQIQGHKPGGMTFVYQGRLSDKLVDKTLKKVIKWAVKE
ncbi:MAG: phage integrase SAM-like domain-containing protein [Bacteroidota bacterium]